MKMPICSVIWLILPFFTDAQFGKLQESSEIFKTYKKPIVASHLYDKLKDDDAIIYIGCYFSTDTLGYIRTFNFIPLTGIGNSYAISDSIWSSAVTSLTEACKQWVFNPIFWNFKKDRVLEKKLNKHSYERPFNARPNYFLVFEFSGLEGSLIHKISFENRFNVQ